jgi:glyoxylase-like metal-dependent hydrolase (beta-lactamase superfamily II)
MILLRARNASSWTGATGNNTYLLPGRVPALIDAGVGDPAHVQDVADALGGATLAVVLITHGHVDHVSGVPALVQRWPSVRVIRASHGVEPVAAGDTELRPIPTPGHAPDHVCFLDEQSRDVFCGDLLRADGTIVIPGSKGGHMGQYLESLRLVRDLRPRRLLPGHGPIVTDPASLIATYLRHREEREAQVLDALRSGAVTQREIVARIYGPLPATLIAAAEDSVRAHLVKLEEEGRV